MVNTSILKHLLSDDQSLSDYFQGNLVSIKDVKRRLFLMERSQNTTIPDHFYQLKLENDAKKFIDIRALLSRGLPQFANNHLTLKGTRIYVKTEKFSTWQQLITLTPPLVLMAAQLFHEKPISNKKIQTIRKYYNNLVGPNMQYSALPYPNIPEMESWLTTNGGLHDLHIHLNGATETDIAWQDFLFSPDKLYKDLKEGVLKLKVLEQFEQESHLLNPRKLYQLIKIARRIRQLFFEFIFSSADSLPNPPLPVLLKQIINNTKADLNVQNYKHPFLRLIENGDSLPHNLSVEGLMYVLIFGELNNQNKPALASLFHFYLLILGLFNRLLVQQVHQYGFDQFQKYTFNKLRDQSELKYHNRFFQMHGNELRNISTVEGRFSPKESEILNQRLLKDITDGWGKFKKHVKLSGLSIPNLTLVAHFIKRKEKYIDKNFRYKELRIDIRQRADVLTLLLRNAKYKRSIVGVDAASNELDTPPEVFGPVFRRLRRAGSIRHFTFHTGEDFFHILSGIRSIYEAVVFTALEKNDRIGHATAVGIKPEIWFSTVGKIIFIRRGEWLDNLIFVHYFIQTYALSELSWYLPKVEKEIDQLLLDIYDGSPDLNSLKMAWHLRQFCPMHVLATVEQDVKNNRVFDRKEWAAIKKYNPSTAAIKLYKKYNSKSIRSAYDYIISIDSDFIDKDSLQILQIKMLEFLHKKEIVIETLPTSNVRISCYNDYSEHHLWNWKNWKERGLPIPRIVVGSDDTGIFATSIYNEYAHLYCQLTEMQKMNSKGAMVYINELEQNGVRYRFKVI